MSGLIDFVNLHHFQPHDSLPEVVSFLRNRTNKPVMSTAVGIKSRTRKVEPVETAKEMIKKMSILLAMDVKPIIWFSPTPAEEATEMGGIVDGEHRLIEPMWKAFKVLTSLLNRPVLSQKDLSNGRLTRYSFAFSSENVDVVWSDTDKTLLDVPAGCRAYDFQEKRIDTSKLTVDDAPIFIACSK